MKRIARSTRRQLSRHLPRQVRPQAARVACARGEARPSLLSEAEVQALMAVAAGEDPAKAWNP